MCIQKAVDLPKLSRAPPSTNRFPQAAAAAGSTRAANLDLRARLALLHRVMGLGSGDDSNSNSNNSDSSDSDDDDGDAEEKEGEEEEEEEQEEEEEGGGESSSGEVDDGSGGGSEDGAGAEEGKEEHGLQRVERAARVRGDFREPPPPRRHPTSLAVPYRVVL